MSSKLNPYLTFLGQAQEAMEFYKTVFGGELTLQTYKDMNSAMTPEMDDKIMHSQLIADNEMTIMASDDPEAEKKSENVSIALSGDDEVELRKYWDKLNNEATVIVPYEKAPWGDVFGMLIDKYGIRWMVNVNTPKN